MGLLVAASRTLGEFLDHDPHFAHRFSRSPFYQGDDPTAYRWYCLHKRVYRLVDLLQEVRTMMGHTTGETNAGKAIPRGECAQGRCQVME
ncbi:replication initiation protein [Corynebacterium tapiri]|uniref:Uncharacterized protein n=1 Tax=Corynebacterium tapiri TaxID=1448266 RepID=A0A5C4U1F7_9CORY|nr:replication initiation protein [Corynebacterium tapiri]TNL94839.1 hypothetical protein FHE74_10055 [Corynebacterium tapiri]